MTAAAPAVPAGVTAVILVALIADTFAAAVPPMVTVAPAANPVPVIEIAVPPAVGPVAGATLVTTGGATYTNAAASVAFCPSGFVTVTAAGPADPAGAVAAIVVLFTTFTDVASAPPTRTLALATKFDPVIVSDVPPDAGPEPGVTPLTVGGAMYVNAPARVPLCPSALVTVTSTGPVAPAGVTAVIVVALTTATLVAGLAPIVTVAPAVKLVPVIVIAVAPLVGPELGVTLTIDGGPT